MIVKRPQLASKLDGAGRAHCGLHFSLGIGVFGEKVKTSSERWVPALFRGCWLGPQFQDAREKYAGRDAAEQLKLGHLPSCFN